MNAKKFIAKHYPQLTFAMSDASAAMESYYQAKSKEEAVEKRKIIPTTQYEFKKACCAFFRWGYNAPGNNIEQGFDRWYNEISAFGKEGEE